MHNYKILTSRLSLYENQYELYANTVTAKDGIKAVSFVFGLGDKEI